MNIAFIGGGNMAASLIGGLVSDGFSAANIWVADTDGAKRQALSDGFGVTATSSNLTAAEHGDVLVLAVKPQVVNPVAVELADIVRRRDTLVISIAAGIRTIDLDAWLGGGAAIVRAMPNTPALVRSAATGLFANARVDAQRRAAADSILRAVGVIQWLDDEAQMDAVTALSGSGPAYFFLLMEALENAAVNLGLTRACARSLTAQTALGAARMALQGEDDSATLRARVTSPGGTTEQAIRVLREGHIEALLDAAVHAAYARSVELAADLGKVLAPQ